MRIKNDIVFSCGLESDKMQLFDKEGTIHFSCTIDDWKIVFSQGFISIEGAAHLVLEFPEVSWQYEYQGSMFRDGGISAGAIISSSKFSLHVWTREFLSKDDPNWNEGDKEGDASGTLEVTFPFGRVSFTIPFSLAKALMQLAAGNTDLEDAVSVVKIRV